MKIAGRDFTREELCFCLGLAVFFGGLLIGARSFHADSALFPIMLSVPALILIALYFFQGLLPQGLRRAIAGRDRFAISRKNDAEKNDAVIEPTPPGVWFIFAFTAGVTLLAWAFGFYVAALLAIVVYLFKSRAAFGAIGLPAVFLALIILGMIFLFDRAFGHYYASGALFSTRLGPLFDGASMPQALSDLGTALVTALGMVTTLDSIGWIILGTVIGIVVGAIPGIGPALGTALALPFTVYMDPLPALLLIIALYDGAMYGGSIPSILMNTPGDGSAAATTLDGYPMAKDGKAITALTVSSTASALGGLIGDMIAIFGSIFMLPFLLLFGTPEYFLLGLFGIVLVSLVSKGAFYKALLSGLLGLGVTVIGIAPGGSADLRYTFNSLELYDGISFLPILLGLFGVATMASLHAEKSKQISVVENLGGSRREGILMTLRQWPTLIKSSVLGFIIGAIPGTGGTVATFVSYGEAVRTGKKDKIPFGHGNPRGLIATESANNASIDGALIPTLIFGIPGSATTAIVLAAMLLHGLRPGTAMFEGEGYALTIALFLGLLYSEIVITIIGLASVRVLGSLTTINKHMIIPIVLLLSFVGIFSIHFNWFDVWVMIGAGLIGYLMTKFGFPVIPAVIGVVLGGIIEENLLRTLELGGGSLGILGERPLSIILLLMTLAVLVAPIVKATRRKTPTE